MSVAVENLEGLRRQMRFTVPEERIYRAVQDRLDQVATRVEVKGFRPGKAPRHLIERQVGHDVRQEVIAQVLMQGFYEAARQENLSPAGPPEIEPASRIAGYVAENSEFIAIFEVYPDIELAPYAQIRIERPRVVVSEQDVERMLASLLLLKTKWIPVERPAEKGDRLIFDLQGEIAGSPVTASRGVPWILGAPAAQGSNMPSQMEFEAGMYGCRVGDVIDIVMGLPESQGGAQGVGKPGKFRVTVTEVAEPIRPELNDEFAEEFGMEGGGLPALRKATRQNMEQEGFAASYHLTKRRLFDALVEHNPCQLPEGRLQSEVERLCESAKAKRLAEGAQEWQICVRPEQFEGEARRHVTLAVILAKIIRENDLKAPREAVDGVLDTLAASYENPEDLKSYYREHPELMEELESTVLEDVVVEWLLSQVQVADIPVAYADLLGGGGPA